MVLQSVSIHRPVSIIRDPINIQFAVADVTVGGTLQYIACSLSTQTATDIRHPPFLLSLKIGNCIKYSLSLTTVWAINGLNCAARGALKSYCNWKVD